MEGKELIAALERNTEAMDRVAKTNYLNFMAIQKEMEGRTATTSKWGSFGFNPGGNVNITPQWRQLVPRNPRRKYITFAALNQSLYFSHSETQFSIQDLINMQKNGQFGELEVALWTFGAGSNIKVESTEAVYCASLTGAGSVVEQTAIVNWIEVIYSDVSSEPFTSTEGRSRAGVVQRLTTADMDLDGDIRAAFSREGVR